MVAEVLLMEVYADYLNDKYTETATTADRYLTALSQFGRLRPMSIIWPGMASYGNMPDVHRDQAHVVKGVKYFQIILDKYPKSQYAAEARSRSRSPATSSPATRSTSAAIISSATQLLRGDQPLP